MSKYIFAEQRAANYPRLRSGYCDKYCDLWLIKRDVRAVQFPGHYQPADIPRASQKIFIHAVEIEHSTHKYVNQNKCCHLRVPCPLLIYIQQNIPKYYHNSSIKSLLTQVLCPDHLHQWPLAASQESICFSVTTHRQFSTRISSYLLRPELNFCQAWLGTCHLTNILWATTTHR